MDPSMVITLFTLLLYFIIVTVFSIVHHHHDPEEKEKKIPKPKIDLDSFLDKPYVPSKPPQTKKTGKKYLVTGGHGFVGKHLVESLLLRGETDIIVIDRQLSNLFKDNKFVTVIQGDIMDKKLVKAAMKGVQCVYHCAAKLSFGSRFSYDRQKSIDSNVIATQNVIEACQENGVSELIYTGSVAVFYKWGLKLTNADGECRQVAEPPYFCHYTESKILAEQLVLAANGKCGLKTGSLRIAGGIWGPREMMLVPNALESFPRPFFSVKGAVGKQEWIYVTNVVHSHLMLEQAFDSQTLSGGQAYMITNHEPMPFREFLQKTALALKTKFYEIPAPLLAVLAYISEGLLFISRGKFQGKFFNLTPTTLHLTQLELTFDPSKALRDFNYKPVFSMEEGFREVEQFYNIQQYIQ